MSPWTSRWNLTVWTRWESHLQSQKLRPFKDYQGVWKITLWKWWEEEAQTWDHWRLLLPSNTARKVYDESVCPQLGQIPCKNVNDWYETDYNLTRLFYRLERIKRVPSWQNFIADLLYGHGRIRRHHCWQMLYRGRRIIMRSQRYKQAKRRKEWDRVWIIFSYRWSAELF